MRRSLAGILAATSLASLAWVAVPIVLIHPFRAQTSRMLEAAYTMRGRAPAITLALLVAGALAAAPLWRRLASRRGRALAGSALAILAGGAVLARQNHFEWIFRPLPRPGFAAAGETPDLQDEDLVLGVTADAEARAYPVRALAYHHLVNDVIDGEPIVATY